MIASEALGGICGIYCAIHRDSGRCYVGSSVRVGKRIREHIYRANRGDSGWFYKHLRGRADEFDWELLEECAENNLIDRELFWMKFLGCVSVNGFNTLLSSTVGPRGMNHTELSKARMSAAKKGRAPSDSCILAARLRNTGRTFTQEHKAKIGAAHKGKSVSREHIERMVSLRRKPILQLCPTTGAILAEYAHRGEAAKKLGITGSNIGTACRSQKRMSGGFLWRFRDE